MPAPTNVPEWNTGGVNRTNPPAGVKVDGFTPSGPFNGSFVNWILFTIYEWVLYLQNLTAETLTWTAVQTFRRIDVVGTATGIGADLFVNSARTNAASSGILSQMPVTSAGKAVEGFGHIGVLGTNDPANATVGGAGVRGECSVSDAAGVEGVATGAGVAGVLGTHTGSGPGLRGVSTSGVGSYGQGSTFGLEGASFPITGGSGTRGVGFTQGVIGECYAGSNGRGVRGVGNGTGPGLSGQGGANSGPGVDAVGGGPNGIGATFTGAGAGAGVFATGGASGVGGKFTPGGGASALAGAQVDGCVDFSFALSPAGNAAVSRQFHAKHGARAWALLTLNNTTSPTIVDRIGIATAAQITSGAGVVTLTLAQPMASGAFGLAAFAFSNISNARVTRARSISATQVEIEIYDPSAPGSALTAAATNSFGLFVLVFGEQ